MVLVVRKDLGMSTGKIAAQCCHAAVAVVEQLYLDKQDAVLNHWQMNGATKIALKVESEAELIAIHKKARELKLSSEYIRDAGRTQIAAGSMTCCSILGPASLVNKVTGKLSLL